LISCKHSTFKAMGCGDGFGLDSKTQRFSY
jgi:hypothetical protein